MIQISDRNLFRHLEKCLKKVWCKGWLAWLIIILFLFFLRLNSQKNSLQLMPWNDSPVICDIGSNTWTLSRDFPGEKKWLSVFSMVNSSTITVSPIYINDLLDIFINVSSILFAFIPFCLVESRPVKRSFVGELKKYDQSPHCIEQSVERCLDTVWIRQSHHQSVSVSLQRMNEQ